MTLQIHTEHSAQHEQDQLAIFDRTIFGFWIYLMTDCVLFATLFAVYAILHQNTFGGPSAQDLFSLPFALKETLILLFSSFTCGIAMLAAKRKHLTSVLGLLLVTFLLGASFLGLELNEFYHLVQDGNSWQKSAFLSSYFTLVGCHGLHITFGLAWILVMMILIQKRGLCLSTMRRLNCFSLFWHFLDVIWVIIFTTVYLMGA